jgi:ribosomal-protein-alanine N-acetyltransferase
MLDRRLEIHPMEESDLDAVWAIERLAHPAPWPQKIFTEELAREWARLDVLRERGDDGESTVVAYVNYWLVRDEVHLLNLATHPGRRRLGYARRLLQNMLEFARRHGCQFATLEVRKSNRAGIALYHSVGFRVVAERPRYYANDDEDALVMVCELNSPEPM